MPTRPSRRQRARLALVGTSLALALVGTACSATDGPGAATGGSKVDPGSSAPKESVAAITSNIRADAPAVGLGRRVKLTVTDGTFTEVAVTGPAGKSLEGALSTDKTQWVSRSPLQADRAYTVTGTAVDSAGLKRSYDSQFHTRKLTKAEQTFPSFYPMNGATVGVGMPVSIRFDVAVTDRAAIEKHLKVTSQPAQAGAFHWVSSNEVHWRPEKYWQSGTKVNVQANIGGVSAGNGIYGQTDRAMSFTIGRSMISKVNIATHQMRVFRDGKLVKTIPVTTGRQPEHTTRSGIKVITEKYRRKRMNSETIGIDPNSADGYDLNDVEYAMRVTNSGEFIHAAPWSVGSQGRANVSHGCTGLSTANAGWLYDNTIVGDVVEYVGSNRGMTLTNGLGDWNTSFANYQAGSALR